MQQHNIICGSIKTPKKLPDGETLYLDVQGEKKNVELRIEAINKATLSNIPDALLDLLEIGAYVYSADQQIGRGSEKLTGYGESWRRVLNFTIPVRNPALWNSPDLCNALMETLGFLSGETYQFSFVSAEKPLAEKQRYFDFCDSGAVPDEIALFSGGIDSFAGAVEGIIGNNRKMALVGHHSANQVKNIQSGLVTALENQGHKAKVQYISVEVRNSGIHAIEYTQRTRSFLFACLAVGIAHMFGKDHFSFYENGIVSLNLPITKDILESRATRTTHPRVIKGFERIFSLVLKKQITIDHPFQWFTKKEVTQKISQYGCESLISQTNSCTRPRSWTANRKHCGACSQCIDRRFGVLAAGLEEHDNADNYKIDLLTGDRSLDKEIVMAASYVKFAQQFSLISKGQFISEHPQITSALSEFESLTSAEAEEKIFQLYKSHSSDVLAVLHKGFTLHRERLIAGTLPSGCLLAVAFYRNSIEAAPLPEYDNHLRETLTHLSTKRCQFYVDDGRIVFGGGYEVTGAGYKLIYALLDKFREAKRSGIDSQFITTVNLADALQVNEASLRRQITRLREDVSQRLAVEHGIVLGTDDFIQNSQRHGYRLNALLKEVNAISDLED